ncbi:MAG: hypothetical protein HYV36_06675 [Lentisphaerae bacterium]|nr:hypothetical protein [Lentisphaerota bacterium]
MSICVHPAQRGTSPWLAQRFARFRLCGSAEAIHTIEFSMAEASGTASPTAWERTNASPYLTPMMEP